VGGAAYARAGAPEEGASPGQGALASAR
jgi:hypothetical protein